ncbi:LytR C-terminal domain-containing protein [Isoptericola sp. BMS4]|uniref:LytR C-terminal domain-containing protein n=1 Tax=Isoptericola sp. BMS4 TaxID=2527875 RepID=UPI001421A29D|nr:LytR C-terminal domain-containing protein [Isoptericola sp. BMS4]
MSKSHYSYPPDEFDVRGPEGTPVGVHREPRSGWSSVWPFLLVIVICGGVAVGAVTFLSRDGEPSTPPAAEQSGGAAAGDEGSGSGDEATDGATDEGASDETSEEPADEPSEESSEEPSDDASEEPSQDVAALVDAADTSAYVRVLNDGGPSGEAGRGAEALEAQGFTTVQADNYPDDSGQTANVVWYVAGREDTAAAVAAILGVPAEETSEQALGDGDVIVVVNEELAVAE